MVLPVKKVQDTHRCWTDNERLAVEEYVFHENTHGHSNLKVSSSGFIIDATQTSRCLQRKEEHKYKELEKAMV